MAILSPIELSNWLAIYAATGALIAIQRPLMATVDLYGAKVGWPFSHNYCWLRNVRSH